DEIKRSVAKRQRFLVACDRKRATTAVLLALSDKRAGRDDRANLAAGRERVTQRIARRPEIEREIKMPQHRGDPPAGIPRPAVEQETGRRQRERPPPAAAQQRAIEQNEALSHGD